ncbi:MAG: hypothetical protein IPP83_01860 [Flavobacteriales bacterium]|nr:hypothetical protein [Flavobacteriales bacterium]
MRAILTVVLCSALLPLRSQERFGLLHSNYAGTDMAYLNPARTAGQWPYADIRFVGVDLNVWNSLVAWSGREQRLVGELRSGVAGNTSGDVVMRGSPLGGIHRGFAQVNVLGPAFSLSLGRGTIGAGIRLRTYTSVTGSSQALGNFIFHGLGFRPQQGIRYNEEGVRALTAAWTEFSVNYAHILKAEGFGMLSAGTNLRYQIAQAGGALQFDGLDYTVVDSAQLIVHAATASYGFAMPTANAGHGFGADVGMVYERTLEEADGYMPHRSSGGCDPLRYRYRIGVSLLDLGGLRFRNGEAGSIHTGSTNIADYTDLRINDQQDLDSLLSTVTQWSREESFRIGMPTALALQYDQRVIDHGYIGFAAVQQLSGRSSTRLRRMNALAVTPRFETRYVEAALPITVQEYDLLRPVVGLMLRFDGVVIGTDNLLPFVTTRDVYSVDFYLRLRWMIHRSPFCKGKRKSNTVHRAGTTEALPCATPND